MGVNISLAARVIFILNCLLLPLVGMAGEEFRTEPNPAWVKPVEIPARADFPEDKIQNGVYYLLIDNQININKNQEPHYYQHFADYIVNQSGVESSSQINIGFHPDYQKVALHTLRIIREGKPIDKFSTARMSVIQREEELDKLIYNGRLTLNIILDDVRVGDIIEYSFSRRGMNPVFQNVFAYSHYLSWSVPVGRLSLRLLWNKPKPLQYKIDNSDLHLVQSKTANGIEYLISADKIEPVTNEENVPSWIDPWGRIGFSEYKSWGDVVQWSDRLFQGVVVDDDNVNRLAADIQAKHNDKKEQISAALRFVQSEIRYLGIELNQNSHKPKPAHETLANRYGDCKDKTVLLNALLNGIGIKAYPALVNTDRNSDKVLPSMQAFDHVITYFELEGKRYWVDPTRGYQYGNIDSIHQPDYGHALILRTGNETLTPMEVVHESYGVVVKDRFVLHTDRDVEFTSESQYAGWNAERQRAQLAEKGLDKLQQEYLKFFQRYYPGIEMVEPIKYHEEASNDTFNTTEKYRIENFWVDDPDTRRYTADFKANIVASSMVIPDAPSRRYPLYLTHPERIEQTIELNFDNDEWKFDDEHFVEDNDFFRFISDVVFKKAERRLTLSYRYQSKVESVAAERYQEYVAALKRADEYKSYSIYRKYPVSASAAEGELWYAKFINPVAVISIIVALYLLVFILWRIERWRRPDTAEALFYPVSMAKLSAMWILTFGVYGAYWFYKNFKYIKAQEGNASMPIARGIFNIFWYYPLWDKLKQDNARRFEVSHLPGKQVAIVLAIIYFAAGIAENISEFTLPVLIVSLLLVLPLANYILFVNGREAPAFIKNSRWSFRHILLVLLSVPLLVLMTGSEVGVLPNGAVVKGNRILNHDIKLMQRRGILEPNDEIEYFYSDAFLLVGDDGNGFTQRHVFSYWKDEDNAFHDEQAVYSDIEDIKVNWNQKFGENTTVTIVRSDGSNFLLYVSNTDRKDKLFVESLKSRWQSHRKRTTFPPFPPRKRQPSAAGQ